MIKTPLFRLADRVVGGNLAETIRHQHDEGLSPDQISLRLYADHELEVPGRTIRRWLDTIKKSAA